MSKPADKLREYFKTTSEEQFNKDWNEVDGTGINGITAEEYFRQLYECQEDMDPEIAEVVAKEYFNMLGGYNEKKE